MNILFITLVDIKSIDEHDIYTDLIREFAKNHHDIYVVSPFERKIKQSSRIINYNDSEIHSHIHILKLKVGNIQKTNIIEKGISTILIEYQLKKGIAKHFKGIHFDLVLYSTPPITLYKPIKYLKKRDSSKTYLLLKDIFPQNAVDLGIMHKNGIRGLLYRYFRNKEKKLYAISDYIGCMSQANVEYVLKHNSDIVKDRVEVCPNSIDITGISLSEIDKIDLRNLYELPHDKVIFVYGGNLGKPQDIPFIIECLKKQVENPKTYFLIIGNGTEYSKLEVFFREYKPLNMRLISWIPVMEYDRIIAACDVGLIFLDNRFTIPNFPSRLLSYMKARLPVIACTDSNTDIGDYIVQRGFGWWCNSNNVNDFTSIVDSVIKSNRIKLGDSAYKALLKDFTVEHGYKIIMGNFR